MDTLTSMLQRSPVGLTDVLDILIAAAAIYELLKLMRGTRAMQMGVGIALIVGIFYLSQWWRLDTVNWLIRNVAGYVVFAAIVLFQSEIRRALAHLGRARFFRFLSRTESNDEIVEELVAAATMLASTKTGAIIAVERDAGLRNYIEGGIPLDATLTSDLLVCVFQPRSPLHDGAVIIQSDRVAAAACFLPLSVNPAISRDFGTRHRAAIGLTEDVDAVAIVVSEETGRIALAIDGQVERGLDADRLRTRLKALVPLRKPASERGATGTFD
ncbi:MAG TPA: diadenylate cyclase CdaA [Vicinamibacterales bacterium]|nr:diadenylate cyclase CdaA [Vicinamibacterales bacterium]